MRNEMRHVTQQTGIVRRGRIQGRLRQPFPVMRRIKRNVLNRGLGVRTEKRSVQCW